MKVRSINRPEAPLGGPLDPHTLNALNPCRRTMNRNRQSHPLKANSLLLCVLILEIERRNIFLCSPIKNRDLTRSQPLRGIRRIDSSIAGTNDNHATLNPGLRSSLIVLNKLQRIDNSGMV